MIFENKCYKLRKCEDTHIDEKNQQRMEKPWHLYLNVSLKTPVLTKFVYAANNNTLWGKKISAHLTKTGIVCLQM